MKSNAIAKITKPHVSGVLNRDRLFRLLDTDHQAQVLWICGPAGAGKTTLAASYLQQRNRPCLWYQVDEGDADIAAFFHYLTLAAKKAVKWRGKQLSRYSPECLSEITLFARRYFEELFSGLLRSGTSGKSNREETESFIIFDNYQDVLPDAQLHGILAVGMDVLPPKIKVILISRTEPPPQYVRLRANNRTILIGWKDISFTRRETAEILHLQNRIKISPAETELLFSRFQGWAAGLVLFNESLSFGSTDLSFLNTAIPQEEIFDYFVEEVYNRLNLEIRDFLLRTSFLPNMTPHTASAISGKNHSGSILKDLSRRNFFTEKRIHPHLSYQYHPLFREFLLFKAGGTFLSEEILWLKRKAASLLEESGQVEDAISLLMHDEDMEALIPLLSEHIPYFLEQGRENTVEGWLKKIPENIRNEHVQFTYYLGLCKMPFNPGLGLNLFESVFHRSLQNGNDQWALTAWSEAVNTVLYGWNDITILDRWMEWLEKWTKQNPLMPSREIDARVSISMAGAIIFRRPDKPEILKTWLDRALLLSRELEDDNLRSRIISYALQYYSALGDVVKSDAVLYDLKRIPRNSINSATAIITLKWIQAVICNWRHADPEAGLKMITEGLQFGETGGVHSGDHFLLTVGSYCALLKGDMAMAGDYLAQVEKTLDSTRYHSFCQYNYVVSLYQLRLGNMAGARQSAETALTYAIETGIYFPVIFCRLGLAMILTESGDYDQAAVHLDAVEAPIKKTNSGILEYSFFLAKSQLLISRNKYSEGLEFLCRSMKLARENGYTSLFWWWHPESMACLCAHALEAGIEEAYVKQLIQTCNLVSYAPASAPENWPFPLKIHTLGRFEIITNDKPLLFPKKIPRKPLEMLKALIASGGRDVREELISDILWPDADGDAAHKSFEVNLVRLRKLLGGQHYILCQNGLVSLDRNLCRIDAVILDNRLKDAEDSWEIADKNGSDPMIGAYTAEAAQKSEAAIRLYKGNFLPADAHHTWTIAFRERLKSRVLQVIIRLAGHLETACSWHKAIEYYVIGLGIDHFSEKIYQRLMISQSRVGQKAEAVTTYHRCRTALSEGLGIRTSEKTEKIYSEIADS